MFLRLLLVLTLHIATARVSKKAFVMRKPFGAKMCEDLCTSFGSNVSSRFVKEELACYLSHKNEVCNKISKESRRCFSRRILSRSKKHVVIKSRQIGKPRQSCAAGYVTLKAGNESMKVKRHKEKMSWMEAKQVCRSEGGSLVKLDTPHKQSAIADNLFHPADVRKRFYMWIGLKDLNKDNTFKWTDGSPLVYSRWYIGEPSHHLLDGVDEDCVLLLKIVFFGVRWNDYRCSEKNGFICEKP